MGALRGLGFARRLIQIFAFRAFRFRALGLVASSRIVRTSNVFVAASCCDAFNWAASQGLGLAMWAMVKIPSKEDHIHRP